MSEFAHRKETDTGMHRNKKTNSCQQTSPEPPEPPCSVWMPFESLDNMRCVRIWIEPTPPNGAMQSEPAGIAEWKDT